MTNEQKQQIVNDLLAIVHAGAAEGASAEMAMASVSAVKALIQMEANGFMPEVALTDLSAVSTKSLVHEIKTRDGVKCMIVANNTESNFTVDGEATVLLVRD